MASNSSTTWTAKQNKLFENALAIYDHNSPDFWHILARTVGDRKTVEDVKLHYDKLIEDIKHIESGQIPLPNYRKTAGSTKKCNNNCAENEEHRMKSLNLQ